MGTTPSRIRSASRVTREFLELVNSCGMPQYQIAGKSGFCSNNFRVWSCGQAAPIVSNMEAALEVLGYELVIRPIEGREQVKPHVGEPEEPLRRRGRPPKRSLIKLPKSQKQDVHPEPALSVAQMKERLSTTVPPGYEPVDSLGVRREAFILEERTFP